MKTNNESVAHDFFYTCEDYGSNFFCEKDNSGYTIYSYGTHFHAACRNNARYGSIVFINSDTYSNSTARHLSYIRRAVPSQYEVLYVPAPEKILSSRYYDADLNIHTDKERPLSKRRTWHSVNTDYFKDEYKKAIFSASKRRSESLKDDDLSTAEYMRTLFEKYHAIFDMPLLKKDIAFFNMDSEELTAELKRASEARKKAEKARAKREAEKQKKELVKWINGESSRPSFYISTGEKFMRIIEREGKKRVQTSGAVEMGLLTVKKAIESIKNGTAKIGDMVGQYSLDRIGTDHVKVGCHLFTYKELDRFYTVLCAELEGGENE